MKHSSLLGLSGILACVMLVFTSCEMVEGIFKAGMGVGIFVVVAVIALIIFIIMKIGRRS